MKYSEASGMTKEELTLKIKEEKEALRSLKFAHAITPVENPMKIRESKKRIAIMMTAFTEKQKEA